jgi:hypothetical protein
MAIAMIALAWATWPVGLAFLWPAAGMGIVALAYLGLGPGVYRKAEGRLPWSTRVLLGPILLGHYLSLVYYRRQCRPWDVVTPQVLIGRQLDDALAAQACAEGVTAVLDLTAESSEARPFLALAGNYRNIQVLDLTRPTLDQMRDMATFIAQHAEQGRVYVHCKMGYSRSAAAVGAYLLASSRAADADDAVDQLRRARPSIIVRPEARQALEEYAGLRSGDR